MAKVQPKSHKNDWKRLNEVGQSTSINSVEGSRWSSRNTLSVHLWKGRSSNPGPTSSGKAGSCLPLVGSLQCRTLTNEYKNIHILLYMSPIQAKHGLWLIKMRHLYVTMTWLIICHIWQSVFIHFILRIPCSFCKGFFNDTPIAGRICSCLGLPTPQGHDKRSATASAFSLYAVAAKQSETRVVG